MPSPTTGGTSIPAQVSLPTDVRPERVPRGRVVGAEGRPVAPVEDVAGDDRSRVDPLLWCSPTPCAGRRRCPPRACPRTGSTRVLGVEPRLGPRGHGERAPVGRVVRAGPRVRDALARRRRRPARSRWTGEPRGCWRTRSGSRRAPTSGWMSGSGWWSPGRGPLPSASTVQMSWFPDRSLPYAIRVPSGDQAGIPVLRVALGDPLRARRRMARIVQMSAFPTARSGTRCVSRRATSRGSRRRPDRS